MFGVVTPVLDSQITKLTMSPSFAVHGIWSCYWIQHSRLANFGSDMLEPARNKVEEPRYFVKQPLLPRNMLVSLLAVS